MSKKTGLIIALVIASLFFFAYATISLKLYNAHQTRGDLTAYAQSLWNTLHGNFMQTTFNYSVHNYWDKVFREITTQNSNLFGIHFSPIMLFLLPIYAIFPQPPTLLVIQALFTALGGLLIYVLACQVLQKRWLAIILEFSYLLYFPTVSATLSQFHAYTLVLFFGPLLIIYSRQKNMLGYYLSLLAFLFIQENTSIVACFFGFSLMISPLTRRTGIITVLFSMLYFVIVLQYVIPALSPYHGYLFGSIYGNKLGGNIFQIIRGSFLHPVLLFQSIFTPANMTYLGNLFIGIGPFALFSPLMLLVGVSSLMQNILSSSLGLKSQIMHYESGSAPFLFYALILGIGIFIAKSSFGKTKKGLFALCLLLIMTAGFSYKKFTSLRFNLTLLTTPLYTERDLEMDSLLSQIPPSGSVSTQDYLSAHLSNRAHLYNFPVYYDRVDYLLLSKGDASWPLTPTEQTQILSEINQNPSYRSFAQTPNFILYSRQSF
ncbi:MAG: DUF2079 domain-containing protein [bacterium]